eukprot:snap_masked-scaffold104_size368486-processed-gene-2.3 protein:Tk07549 transcript:snap_masked-scaffold104_size368486-processed-gene-2.3-mRNA-1 annotation:"28s ribosomal protein mitochondrial"
MAQSRLEKVGTIYSRMRALLNTGAVKEEHTPLWYPLYEAFPPQHEPRWDRVPQRDTPIPRILYREDMVRAQFYRQFGDHHEVMNLLDQASPPPLSQVFLDKYRQIQAEAPPETDFKGLFVRTVDALELDGVRLRAMDREAALKMSSEMMEERDETSPKPRRTMGKPSFRELFGQQSEKRTPSSEE